MVRVTVIVRNDACVGSLVLWSSPDRDESDVGIVLGDPVEDTHSYTPDCVSIFWAKNLELTTTSTRAPSIHVL